jgi:hypothetical protein
VKARRIDFTVLACRIPVENGGRPALQFGVAVGPPSAGRPGAIMLEGDIMSLQSRLESLKTRHASLESLIASEDQRPRPDDTTLSRLKLEKLRLKDEIERLRGQPH